MWGEPNESKEMNKLILLALFPVSAFAWEGYNYETGTYFEIESYDHRVDRRSLITQ